MVSAKHNEVQNNNNIYNIPTQCASQDQCSVFLDRVRRWVVKEAWNAFSWADIYVVYMHDLGMLRLWAT